MRRRTLLVVLLVVALAGCSAIDDGLGSDTDIPGTDEPTVDNPWNQETVVVGIGDVENESRDVRPLVSEAIEYWNGDGSQYATYDVEFVLEPERSDPDSSDPDRSEPDSSEPDLVVEFTEDLDCDGHEVAGCAPVLEADSTVETPLTVQIQPGYMDDSTITILKHEFGHVLGLTHDDQPQEYMAAELNLQLYPLPTVDERDNPWEQTELAVYVDWDDHPDADRERTETQIAHALQYYEDGTDGTTPPLSISSVDDETAADITIHFETGECGAQSSCGQLWGEDLDGHGNSNIYTDLSIHLDDLDQETYGWHVGYWIGMSMTGQVADDLPEPFADAQFHEDRVEWWDE